MKNYRLWLSISILLCGIAFISNLFFGAVSIDAGEIFKTLTLQSSSPLYSTIIIESRLPQALTAAMSGAALAISGLMLQTLFANPLAAPSILGVSSGASVGVAIVMLFMGGSISALGLGGHLAIMCGALIGALLVLAILLAFSLRVKNSVMLLIVGIMVGYLTSSVVSLLSYFSTTEGVYTYVMWGMGDFSAIPLSDIGFYAIVVLGSIALAILQLKPLNALLLGERYCENLGINIKKSRISILFVAGILTAVVTAYCGPISFLGLAVPHIARLLLGTSNHRYLMAITLLCGSFTALICNLLANIAGSGIIIPINVITPFLGAPVIIYVIMNRDKIAYFNN